MHASAVAQGNASDRFYLKYQYDFQVFDMQKKICLENTHDTFVSHIVEIFTPIQLS